MTAQGAHQAAWQSNTWTTSLTQCTSGNYVQASHYCVSCCCCPCAAAIAKSHVDGTSALYNCCCWNTLASYSFVRYEYRLEGTCSNDFWTVLCCGPCAVRQMYTEAVSVRGTPPHYQTGQNEQWKQDCFECELMDLATVVVCPCGIAGETRERLQPASKYDTCFNCCCLVPCAMYGQVRQRYGIRADCPLLEDVCYATVCWPCALHRAAMESRLRVPTPAHAPNQQRFH